MAERTSASSAGRHIACHASAHLELAIPNWIAPVEDPLADNAANRGTIMHRMFAETMGLKLSDLENFIAAQQYVAEVKSRRRFKQLIEETVDVTWLDPKIQTTADLVLYVKDEIHILDLKTGRIPVEVVGNSQLLYYAATYGDLAPNAKGVHLHIVQPWAGVMEEWFVDAAEVLDYMVEVQLAHYNIQKGSTQFGPGDHCTFCPANPRSRGAKGKPFCPALMDLWYPQVVDEQAILEEDA